MPPSYRLHYVSCRSVSPSVCLSVFHERTANAKTKKRRTTETDLTVKVIEVSIFMPIFTSKGS